MFWGITFYSSLKIDRRERTNPCLDRINMFQRIEICSLSEEIPFPRYQVSVYFPSESKTYFTSFGASTLGTLGSGHFCSDPLG